MLPPSMVDRRKDRDSRRFSNDSAAIQRAGAPSELSTPTPLEEIMKFWTRVVSAFALGAATLGVAAPIASAAPSTRTVTTHVAATSASTFRFDLAPTAANGTMKQLAQGGFDRDHWWFKITKAEVIGVGAGVVCRWIFGGIGWFVCPPIANAINQAVSQFPNAGGFWGELYTDGRVRAGTW